MQTITFLLISFVCKTKLRFLSSKQASTTAIVRACSLKHIKSLVTSSSFDDENKELGRLIGEKSTSQIEEFIEGIKWRKY